MRNRVLLGFKKLRDLYTSHAHDQYEPYLPQLIKAQRNTISSYYAAADAQARLDEVGQNKPLAIAPTKPSELWKFQVKNYKEKLHKSLPISNFYTWCYSMLQEEIPQKNIKIEQIFQIANLMFDADFAVKFISKRSQIKLYNGILDIPQIQIAHVLS